MLAKFRKKLDSSSTKKTPKESKDDDKAGEATPAGRTARNARYIKKLREYSLLLEYKRLKDLAPTGVYVLPTQESLWRWHGVIFLRKGFFRKGVFKFVLHIPDGYPDAGPPRVFFISEIFHPLINPDTGELDFSPQFPEWNPHEHFLVLVLHYVKKVFYQSRLWDARPGRVPFNKKAEDMWMKDKEKWLLSCDRCACASVERENVYNNAVPSFTVTTPSPQGAPPSVVRTEPCVNAIHLVPHKNVHTEAFNRIVSPEHEQEVQSRSFSYITWFTDGVRKLGGDGHGGVLRFNTAVGTLPPLRPLWEMTASDNNAGSDQKTHAITAGDTTITSTSSGNGGGSATTPSPSSTTSAPPPATASAATSTTSIAA